MRSLRSVVAFLSAVSMLIAVVGPAAATTGQPDQVVPFRMSIVAAADEPLNYSPGFPFAGDMFDGRCSVASSWVTTINSVGTAGHLGRVSVTQSHCTIINVFAAPPLIATFADGEMIITAANGDELWLEYSGSFDFYPVSETVGTSYITYAVMDVIGGTGRFVDATGSISGTAVDEWPGGPNVATFHGTITYAASNVAGG